MVQARGEREDPLQRDPAVRGLDRADSAHGGPGPGGVLTPLLPPGAAGSRGAPPGPGRGAAGTTPAASAAPEPPLEPPAVRSTAHGLPTWSVVPPAANSCVWVWPTSTIPSA